jgi:hypothetical protein
MCLASAYVHVRRALLLFAIVIGLAALAAALSQPSREPRSERAPAAAPEARPVLPRTGPLPDQLRFSARREGTTRRLPLGRRATVSVAVDEPGQVELTGLGLTADADSLTPARFEVFAYRAARVEVRFRPAGRGESERLGLLVLGSAVP